MHTPREPAGSCPRLVGMPAVAFGCPTGHGCEPCGFSGLEKVPLQALQLPQGLEPQSGKHRHVKGLLLCMVVHGRDKHREADEGFD